MSTPNEQAELTDRLREKNEKARTQLERDQNARRQLRGSLTSSGSCAAWLTGVERATERSGYYPGLFIRARAVPMLVLQSECSRRVFKKIIYMINFQYTYIFIILFKNIFQQARASLVYKTCDLRHNYLFIENATFAIGRWEQKYF